MNSSEVIRENLYSIIFLTFIELDMEVMHGQKEHTEVVYWLG